MTDLDGNASKATRLRTINKMVKLLTPGTLIKLAELTKTQEDIFRRKPVFFSKMNSYKNRVTRYYNRLVYNQCEEKANWEQAEIYYREIKGKVFHRKFGNGCQELLYDLRNAMIATESTTEPPDEFN